MNWFCAQIGAREHYAVPRALQQVGRSVTLYTDFWAGPVTRGLWKQSRKLKWENRNGKAIGALRSLAARWHSELEEKQKLENREEKGRGGKQKAEIGKQKAEIVAWNLRSFWWEVVKKAESGDSKAEIGRKKAGRGNQKEENREQKAENAQQITSLKDSDAVQPPPFQLSPFPISTFSPYGGFIEVGRRFATRVREDLKRRKDIGPATIFFAYDTGALEALEWCRERGVKCVLNQMDPNRVEVDLVRAEEKQWPGWALLPVQVPEEYFARREREWALADRVVVNSEFSRQALLRQGVPAEKLVVVPLCFEAKAESRKQKAETNTAEGQNQFQLSTFQISALSPLRVLFLGQVILRKGIQYLMAAAKLLEKENIHFDVVGPVGISQEAMATAPANLTFHGRTGRDQAAGWYQRSHLFVLPTLSDGFAITQLEAMAHGVPVVATPNCGEVVSEGVDGFVVPARDAAALADTFRRYLQNPELLRSHSDAALVKARQFTIERLAENLKRLETELTKQKTESRK